MDSGFILTWIFQKNIRQTDVISMMRWLDVNYGLKGIIIRNDNGSQFIAHKVRQALQELEAKQEFTHVATPEENSYIESFHSIEQKELTDRHSFASYFDAKQHITRYMHWYNYQRKHGSLKETTPAQKWAQSMSCLTDGPPSTEASEILSRPADAIKNNQTISRSLPALTKLDWRATYAYQVNMSTTFNSKPA